MTIVVAVVVAVAACVAAAFLPMLRSVELRLLDWRLRTGISTDAIDQVLVVGIQDSTFDALPSWGPDALHRSVYTQLIPKLVDYGARVIAIDVYFGVDAPDAGDDDALAAAIEEAGNVIIVAGATPTLENAHERLRFDLPTPKIAEAAGGVTSQLLFRPDGVVRWVNLWQEDDEADTTFPALSFAAVQIATDAPVEVPDSNWPMMLIRWAGRSGTVPHVPLEDVHAGRVDAELIRGRIVFIGRWDKADDLFQTPKGPMNGVEIHAQAAATVLAGKYVVSPGFIVALLTAVPLCVLLAFLSVGRRGWRPWLLTGLAVCVWAVVACAVFRLWAIALPMTGTALAIITSGVALAALQSERAVGFLSHLSPSWVTAEGEEIEATVLVCDLAGYTAKSERTAPAEMMALLRQFFAIVDETVADFGGVLARRPGDAAIVFFRPEADECHHAGRGIRAALALSARLNQAWQDTDIGFGITLTTGPVSLGFVGTSPPEPQILGDPVNVAFRLQSECRERGECILADWPTATGDPEIASIMRPLGEVQVRHRSAPVQIFAPHDPP